MHSSNYQLILIFAVWVWVLDIMLKSQVCCDPVTCGRKYISGVCSVPGTEPLKILTMIAIKMSLVVLLFGKPWGYLRGFPGMLVVKNLPANARDMGLIPWSRRSPGRGMAAHSSALAWRIPWTEEPGGLLSMVLQSVGHDWSDLAYSTQSYPRMRIITRCA